MNVSVVGLKLDVVYFVSGQLLELLHMIGAVNRYLNTRVMQNTELSGHDPYLH